MFIHTDQPLITSIYIKVPRPGYKDKFLCRESSNPESEQKLVDEFVAELETLHALLLDNLPAEITDGIQKLDEEIQALRFGFDKTQLASLKKFLEQYCVLQIYGFNAGKILFFLLLHCLIFILLIVGNCFLEWPNLTAYRKFSRKRANFPGTGQI